MPQISIEDTNISYVCDRRDTILHAALREGLGFPYECNVGSCGMCKYQLKSGTVDNLWSDAPAIHPRDNKRQRMLGCQTKPTSDCIIKINLNTVSKEYIRPSRFNARLISIKKLTHDMMEFQFFSEVSPKFLPGQYALLTFPGVNGLRALSMSNNNNPDKIWSYVVKRVKGGMGTSWLFGEAKQGDQIKIDGPYGHAWLRINNSRPIICLAGGSGIGAMLSISKGYFASSLGHSPLRLYYGCRTPKDVINQSLVMNTLGSSYEMIYENIVSEPDSSWEGKVGLIHDFLFKEFEISKDLLKFDFYIAGPPTMVDTLRRGLIIDYKVPADQVFYDQFY